MFTQLSPRGLGRKRGREQHGKHLASLFAQFAEASASWF